MAFLVGFQYSSAKGLLLVLSESATKVMRSWLWSENSPKVWSLQDKWKRLIDMVPLIHKGIFQGKQRMDLKRVQVLQSMRKVYIFKKIPITFVCKDSMNTICKTYHHSKCLTKLLILWNLKGGEGRIVSCHSQTLKLILNLEMYKGKVVIK